MTTALTERKAVPAAGTHTFSPTNLTEAMEFSKLIANSDLAPKDFKGKPGNVLVAMQMGAEIGLSPMQAIQNIAVINGRPSVWGDAALAIVQGHHAYEWHTEVIEGEGENKGATFTIKRRGHEPHVSRFTVADAKRAGLWGKQGPWVTHPGRMLTMRARGFGLRDKFADALKGIITAEEAQDMPVEANPAGRTGADVLSRFEGAGAAPAIPFEIVPQECTETAPFDPEPAAEEPPQEQPSQAPAVNIKNPGDPCTEAQQKKIHMAAKAAGIAEADLFIEINGFLRPQYGEEYQAIGSTKELTKGQASSVIEYLIALKDQQK